MTAGCKKQRRPARRSLTESSQQPISAHNQPTESSPASLAGRLGGAGDESPRVKVMKRPIRDVTQPVVQGGGLQSKSERGQELLRKGRNASARTRQLSELVTLPASWLLPHVGPGLRVCGPPSHHTPNGPAARHTPSHIQLSNHPSRSVPPTRRQEQAGAVVEEGALGQGGDAEATAQGADAEEVHQHALL